MRQELSGCLEATGACVWLKCHLCIFSQIIEELPTQLRMILSTAFVTLGLIYANEQNV